jgi:NAD(P)-dependent dehydrogenase (short-subunit alcohol dehydrogenase family)
MARNLIAEAGGLRTAKLLVTGGDSGIGRAAVIAFAREGADVVISYLPSEEADAKEVLALIEAAGRKAYGISGDVSNESFCRKLIQQAHKSWAASTSLPSLPVSNMLLRRSRTSRRSNWMRRTK